MIDEYNFVMGRYDTHLSPYKELAFKLAAKKAGRSGDVKDYDLRGAWLENPSSIAGRGHLSDKWKKPSHPTFSSESVYSSKRTPGGNWVKSGGGWSFTPSRWQISAAGGLRPFGSNFRRSERGQSSGVVIPPSY